MASRSSDQRASGLRRQVPMAEQGASTRTPSKLRGLPATCLPSPSQALVVTLRKGLRRARRTASLSRPSWTSVATTTPLAPHQGGEVERLAAGPGAGVPPALAGVGVADQGDGLRGEVLDLQVAPRERGQVVDVGVGVELRRAGRSCGGPRA